jgi:hypothetical protein
VRRLEQHVRRAASTLRTRATSSAKAAQVRKGPQERARPRCPGCTLELPRGRRKETCVWCGFHFSAVRRRASKG